MKKDGWIFKTTKHAGGVSNCITDMIEWWYKETVPMKSNLAGWLCGLQGLHQVATWSQECEPYVCTVCSNVVKDSWWESKQSRLSYRLPPNLIHTSSGQGFQTSHGVCTCSICPRNTKRVKNCIHKTLVLCTKKQPNQIHQICLDGDYNGLYNFSHFWEKSGVVHNLCFNGWGRFDPGETTASHEPHTSYGSKVLWSCFCCLLEI